MFWVGEKQDDLLTKLFIAIFPARKENVMLRLVRSKREWIVLSVYKNVDGEIGAEPGAMPTPLTSQQQIFT